MFIFYPIIEIFILDIENTFIKIEEKKKKAVQTDVKRKQFKHQHK